MTWLVFKVVMDIHAEIIPFQRCDFNSYTVSFQYDAESFKSDLAYGRYSVTSATPCFTFKTYHVTFNTSHDTFKDQDSLWTRMAGAGTRGLILLCGLTLVTANLKVIYGHCIYCIYSIVILRYVKLWLNHNSSQSNHHLFPWLSVQGEEEHGLVKRDTVKNALGSHHG